MSIKQLEELLQTPPRRWITQRIIALNTGNYPIAGFILLESPQKLAFHFVERGVQRRVYDDQLAIVAYHFRLIDLDYYEAFAALYQEFVHHPLNKRTWKPLFTTRNRNPATQRYLDQLYTAQAADRLPKLLRVHTPDLLHFDCAELIDEPVNTL